MTDDTRRSVVDPDYEGDIDLAMIEPAFKPQTYEFDLSIPAVRFAIERAIQEGVNVKQLGTTALIEFREHMPNYLKEVHHKNVADR